MFGSPRQPWGSGCHRGALGIRLSPLQIPDRHRLTNPGGVLHLKFFRFSNLILFYLKAKQRVDSSFSALSRALQGIPDLIDRVGRRSQEEILNPSAQDTDDQGEEHVAQAGQRSVA